MHQFLWRTEKQLDRTGESPFHLETEIPPPRLFLNTSFFQRKTSLGSQQIFPKVF